MLIFLAHQSSFPLAIYESVIVYLEVSSSIVKIHVTIFREKYSKLMTDGERKNDDIWDLKIARIIPFLEKLNDISYEERVNLEIINGNRNMVHILGNKSVWGYDDYLKYVYLFFETFKKLNLMQHLFVF